MGKLLEVASYRNDIYGDKFPTGSWLGVKELALPEFMIEIELEVHVSAEKNEIEEYPDQDND